VHTDRRRCVEREIGVHASGNPLDRGRRQGRMRMGFFSSSMGNDFGVRVSGRLRSGGKSDPEKICRL